MVDYVLTRLQVENLACFGQLDLRPGRSTLLLGRNGAGKSTLMDLIFQLGAVVNAGHGVEGRLAGY